MSARIRRFLNLRGVFVKRQADLDALDAAELKRARKCFHRLYMADRGGFKGCAR